VKVVGIGGGHGLAVTLAAARTFAVELAAVVTVADDGGSSGRLTRELGIPPPGDIRNCLVALARDEDLAALYQHRFESGALTGHTAGNLLIAALTEMRGNFASAVAEAGKLLRCAGKVYPATTELVGLGAHVIGGQVHGQVAVQHTTSRIQAVYLKPSEPEAHLAAVEAILDADLVVLGPGSLFTSLIATLLVPGIRKAMHETEARRIFVCNTRMQKGETEGLDAAAHVEALLAHAGAFATDVVIVQEPVIEPDGVEVDPKALAFSGIEIVRVDVADASGAHDPGRLAGVLSGLA
jgi:uncharacterized cofD-like protein